jgi:hypothetical protein
MRIAGIALVLMVAFGAWAQSHPPVPTPSKTGNEPKQQPENETKKANDLSSATSQQPSAAVFTASPSIYIGTPYQKNRTEEKAPTDWWSPILTFGLLIVAILQWRTYRRQAGLMRTQADISFEQKDIMKEGLVAHRRPKFVIREMLQLPLTEGSTLNIRCAIGNGGDAEGTIVESYIDAQLCTFEGWKPRRPGEKGNRIGPVSIAPGSQTYWDIDCNIGEATMLVLASGESAAANAPWPSTQIQPPPMTIHLHGFVVYVDKHDVRRRTAFLRHLDIRTLRFHRRDDPDYEYAD